MLSSQLNLQTQSDGLRRQPRVSNLMVLRFNVALISEAESCEAATTNQKMVGLQPSIASLD